ncbi:DEAD/DEAH box helicase [Paenibacillus sp. J2TS4]|uniref:DEAD/DEAH box helicase n=1 Tax=Paenibacillus sp. J2TS4 TaxID=2807194 RepID=UPI001B0C32A3|nr:DEAD/DEAH box helicase [Paenibacillus sp. J2TS4]GIP34854.1 helicase SNF [Paenibacillus sp. J2TS4]
MSFKLTDRIIKLLCGQLAYKRGEAYYSDDRVTFTRYDSEASLYEATVKGSRRYEVSVEVDQNGDVDAECTCPAFYSYDNYCKHIAAVLLYIQEKEYSGQTPARTFPSLLHLADPSSEEGGAPSPRLSAAAGKSSGIPAGDLQLTRGLLNLFGDPPSRPSRTRTLFDIREPLNVQFICKPVSYGYRNNLFGLEMKIGTKRLYIVQKIKEFLGQIDQGEAHEFSKLFSYDPEVHFFRPEDDAVIQQLIQICHNENIYLDSSHVYPIRHGGMDSDRLLMIPPISWETLLPLLAKAPAVQLQQGLDTYEGIHLSDELPPLHFEFDQAQAEGYHLEVRGLDQITFLEPYRMILTEGKLRKLPDKSYKRLKELKKMLGTYRRPEIRIAPEQMEPLMEKVIPGLMKLGSVRIAQAISDRIVQAPLKARLYLDRVKDRLLAGLEFHYGNIVIHPLEGDEQKRSTDRILVRDGDRERRILELMEQSSFARTEGGYFLNDEDAEYEFLYHIVPQLEELAEVYATTAVKVRLFTGHASPKVTVEVDERTDWLEFRFDMGGIPESDIRKLLKSLEEKRKYYRLPNGALMPLETAEFQEISRFMSEIGLRKGERKGATVRLPIVRGLSLIGSERSGNAVKLGKAFRQLLENMRHPDQLEFPVPVSLAPILRDYQKYGFQWMRTLAHYRFGGILADDMGLGKTLQSIAFIVSMLPEIRDRMQPAIIVSPASLVYNWRNELTKFAPDIRAAIADGSQAERSDIVMKAAQWDVIITSYPLLRRDIGEYAGQSFHTLILDEAQAFKNHATQTAQAVKQLQARYRFALTGTPVENRLEELWSIFDAVFPGLFPGRKAFNELSREAVSKRARPFLLRRLKADVLKELPEKIESLQASELLPEQKKLYLAYLAKLQQETLKHLNEDDLRKNRLKILAGLTRLRQLCCHPALFVEGYRGGSAKFEQLMDIVEDCRSAGKRMLVFSQFTEMLALIGRELGSRGVPFFYLDGRTPASERVELCSRFNEGEKDLFLISLKAGGTGLNLTGADTVILYDLWWNPAVEEQAADRAHRIGQKKVVQVIRLVAQGTVEDKMYELQQKKKHLIDEVIQPGQEALSALTEEDIREILMIG